MLPRKQTFSAGSPLLCSPLSITLPPLPLSILLDPGQHCWHAPLLTAYSIQSRYSAGDLSPPHAHLFISFALNEAQTLNPKIKYHTLHPEPSQSLSHKSETTAVSDAEARTILKGSYDIDQIDECYGGTLIRGPLFSLPGNGRLRPEAVAKGAEPSESGLGGDSAASLN